MIPIIIGATGTTSRSFRKYVSNIPGNHEVKELQETAILGTAHILRKVLTQRYNGVNTGTTDILLLSSSSSSSSSLSSSSSSTSSNFSLLSFGWETFKYPWICNQQD
jgi:hypothetical protein